MRVSRGAFLALALSMGSAGAFGRAAGQEPSAQEGDPAPQYVAATWTVDDGLPANLVSGIVQDSTGYLWVATLQGMARFDGVRFTVFTTRRSPGLPSDRIRRPVKGPSGAIWFVTEQNHLVRMRSGVFTLFDEARGIPDRITNAVYADPLGGIWAATRVGVFRLAGERFEPVAGAAIRVPVSTLHLDREGTLWVGTGDAGLSGDAGLYRVDGPEVTHFPVDDRPIGRVGSVLRDRAGTVWVGAANGLFRWRGGGGLEPVSIEGSSTTFETNVTDLRESPRPGPVWVGASDGIWAADEAGVRPVMVDTSGPLTPQIRVDPDGVVWYALRDRLYRDGRPVFRLPDPGPDDVSANTRIRDMEWDREGNLWLGTVRDGLFRLKPATFLVVGVPEGLPDRNVTVLLEDRVGAVWIGTRRGGIARLVGDRVTAMGRERGVPGIVTAILEDRDGGVWLGAPRETAYCAAGPRSCAPLSDLALPGTPSVHALHQDTAGVVWAGTNRGLFRLEDGVWRRMETGTLGASTVRAFLERADGTLFMATNGAGVLVWRGGRFSTIRVADGLPTDLLRSLYLDADGRLWVGTEGHGLVRITLAESPDGTVAAEAVRVVERSDGLAGDVIHRMLEDDAGRLWMSANQGVFWVALSELVDFADGRAPRVHSTLYTERDGLRSREGNGGTFPPAIRTRDGRLWFATQNGVAVVDPATVRPNPVPPPVAIEDVSTSGRSLAAGGGRLVLEPDERDFEIDYTALRLSAPEKVRFRYRLEGLSEEWTDAGDRRTAYFTHVPPGNYTFQVTAAGDEDLWTGSAATLALRVAPRFYETGTAKVLLALAALSLLVVAHQWRLRALRTRERELTSLVEARTAELRRNKRRLEAQNARLAELDQAKSRLFTNLSHEFRTPLTLILGPLRSLLDGRHGSLPPAVRSQGNLMLRNAQRLLRLVNQVLDLSRLEAGHVTLAARPGDLVAFARATTLAFSPLAERRGVDLRFEAETDTLAVAFDRDQLEKVLLNLLSNAMKFTPEGGSVTVSVATVDGDARMVVRDTGIGIAPDEMPHLFDRFHRASRGETRRYEGTGIGLALTKELVELHGGEIRAESRPGEGSTFTVRLPRGPVPPHDRAAVAAGESEADGGEPAAPGGEAPEPDALDAYALDPPVDATGHPPGVVPEDAEDRTSVLVVDDNADVRAYVRSVLAPSYHVLEAADGRAGLELAREALPDVIVADVMMPELDGLALGRALRDDAMTDAIPLILLTARAEAGDRVEGLRTGADAYLVKPFDPTVLDAQVANLLEQRRRLRERFRSGEAEPPRAAPVTPPEASTPTELELRLRPIVEACLLEPDFGPHELAAAADMSYHQLYRALRSEMELTPSRFIRTVRVECAAELLRRRAGSVTEIAYSVGFESLSYFNRSYRERFDVPPSQHLGVAGGV